MSTDVAGNAAASAQPKWMNVTGWVMTVLPSLLLAGSGGAKVAGVAAVIENMQKFGYSPGAVLPLGLIEVLSTVLFLVPKTSVLGAVILTGYLGGAISTHLRAGESWVMPLVLGVVLWGGIFLREPRLRALLPLRK